jgi:long-chain acyl-CoA synthetase
LKGGETLGPQLIESRLRFSPYIKDAWILGGPVGLYASAVIVIDYDNVGSWAGEKRLPFSTFTELAQRPEVYDLVKQDIDRVNRTLSPASRVRKYINLHREFDPDEGELTRTRKLRRAFLEERYRELIEAIYSDKAEVSNEALVGCNDGRMGTAVTTLRIRSVGGAD